METTQPFWIPSLVTACRGVEVWVAWVRFYEGAIASSAYRPVAAAYVRPSRA
jgi:hypothetical protein